MPLRSPTRLAAFVALAPLAIVACSHTNASTGGATTVTPSTSASVTETPHAASTTVPVPGACSEPRRTPPDSVGCYLAATQQLGVVGTTPLYWHIDRYPTRAAAESARGDRSVVGEAHGRVWLFTIADADWQPRGGERMAKVGPLPLVAGRTYAAHYIEGVVPAGARTPAHTHAGPEAWYVLEGTNCLQTPDDTRVAHAGETLIVPEGPPMILTGVGPATRRTLAVVVHDASKPWTNLAPTFTPAKSCP